MQFCNAMRENETKNTKVIIHLSHPNDVSSSTLVQRSIYQSHAHVCFIFVVVTYKIANNSTSKYNVAPPGIIPPAPRSPYANRLGKIMFLRSPTFMVLKASSQPRITCPAPTLNWNGRPRSRELSNFLEESNPSSHPV